MRAYSMDLRERVLRDSDTGLIADAVAERYHVLSYILYTLGNIPTAFGHRRTEKLPVGKRQKEPAWGPLLDALRANRRSVPIPCLLQECAGSHLRVRNSISRLYSGGEPDF